MTQGDLSDCSGVSLDAITRIETGSRSPNLKTLERLMKALGVKLSAFFVVMEGSQL